MHYFFILLFTIMLTPVLAQSTHQDLLYSADISTGEARLYNDITLNGHFSVEKNFSDFGPFWKIEAGKFLELHFRLPPVEKVENCRLKVREFGLPRHQGIELDTILIINGNRSQRLTVAESQKTQTRSYDLVQNLRAGNNLLKIGGLDHDLGLQSLVVQCTAPLPTKTLDNQGPTPSIKLLAPIAGQYISADKPLDISWTTANFPDYARLDIDYLDKYGHWQTLDKGIPYNHPTGTGKRGFYRWEKLPADVHPQLQVRLRYDPEQNIASSTWQEKTTGINFIYIPSGCFQIGSPKTETGHQTDEIQTRLCVEGFWMGQTEVINAQYQLKENHDSGDGFNQAHQPVINVSREQARQFAEWLPKKNGETFRLPTEAEWEYAARAGQTTAYPWGNESSQACQFANIADITWRNQAQASESEICNDKYAKTAPVAQFKPNEFGLYDMIGNVAELTCSSMPLSGSYAKATVCDSSGFPVIRGGSWKQFGTEIRFAKRTWHLNPQQTGFRLVRKSKKGISDCH